MGNSAWRRRIERSEIAVAWSAYRVYAMRAIERGVLSQTIAAQSVVLPQRGDRRAQMRVLPAWAIAHGVGVLSAAK